MSFTIVGQIPLLRRHLYFVHKIIQPASKEVYRMHQMRKVVYERERTVEASPRSTPTRVGGREGGRWSHPETSAPATATASDVFATGKNPGTHIRLVVVGPRATTVHGQSAQTPSSTQTPDDALHQQQRAYHCEVDGTTDQRS